MPYIAPEERDSQTINSPGKLNYVLTSVINGYLDKVGRTYTTMNEVVGVLECAKLEFYRRVLAEYEDIKCNINGDVY